LLWQINSKLRATQTAFFPVRRFDPAAVFGDDAVGNAQSQPCAVPGFFGGEEGIEDVFQILRRNAAARVGDARDGELPAVARRRLRRLRNAQCVALRHGLHRVLTDVQIDLI
jgi:hypothetical protein